MKIKISVFIMLVIGIVFIAFSLSKNEKPAVTKKINKEDEFINHIESTAQELFKPQKNNSGSKLNNKSPSPLSKEKLKELKGNINKEYGIREDILRYIEKEIPATNEKAIKAALTYAQTEQFIYYGATPEEAIIADKKALISLHCMGEAIDNYIEISRGLDKLMRNTPERDEHMWDIDERYFGWKVLGFGDTSLRQLKEICEKGEF